MRNLEITRSAEVRVTRIDQPFVAGTAAGRQRRNNAVGNQYRDPIRWRAMLGGPGDWGCRCLSCRLVEEQ